MQFVCDIVGRSNDYLRFVHEAKRLIWITLSIVLKEASSIRDTICYEISFLMSEVYNDVTCEPLIMPLTSEVLPNSSNKADDARADINVRSFWQDGQKAFFDVKVSNPNPSKVGTPKKLRSQREREEEGLQSTCHPARTR